MNKKEMIAEDLKKRGRNSQDYEMRGYGYDENINFGEIIESTNAVSYTHLTLPTILRV